MEPTEDTNIVTEGLGYLTGPYPSQPTIVGFVKSFLQQKQAIETALFPALAARSLLTATLYTFPLVNNVLDVIGRIIGRGRNGLDDHDYQAVLILQVAVNRSAGRIEDWSNLAAILLQASGGPVEYTEGLADFYLFVGDMTLNPNIVAQVLAGAVGNGIGAGFGYSVWPDGNDFEFCDLNNPSTTGQGPFGDWVSGQSGVGGLLVSGAEIV
jgi:hypothetical protein